MRYLTIGEIVSLHRSILEATGGLAGTDSKSNLYR